MNNKKLTVSKTTYGRYKRPVIMLNYHNGGSFPTGEIYDDKIDFNILKYIAIAANNGFAIEYKGFDEIK